MHELHLAFAVTGMLTLLLDAMHMIFCVMACANMISIEARLHESPSVRVQAMVTAALGMLWSIGVMGGCGHQLCK